MIPQLNISVTGLDESEQVTFVSRILPEVDRIAKSVDPTLLEHCEAVEKASAQLVAAISRNFGSDHSDAIRVADTQRGSARSVIKQIATAMSKKSNVEIASAAKRVVASYERAFDGYSIANNAIESERTIVFLADLATQTLAHDIATLDLSEEVSALDLGNREYERLTKLRALEPLEDTGLRLIPSRKELKMYLNHLESHILFKARRGSVSHLTLAEELQKIIVEISAAAKSRTTRKENAKENEKVQESVQAN